MVKVDTSALFLILKEMFYFFPVEYVVSRGLVIYGLHYIKVCFLYSHSLDFVKCFFASIDMIIKFLSFILLMACITLIDLWILFQPCIPGTNFIRSWYMMFLMYCYIWPANIWLRIIASMFIRDIGL